MEKQQTPSDVSRLVSSAMRPYRDEPEPVGTEQQTSPLAGEKQQRSRDSKMSSRFEAIKGLTKNADMILNLICVLLAVGFLALAASNFTMAGSFLSIDSLFLTAVCLMLAGIFLISPALTLKERGLLKNPFKGGEAAAIVEEGPIHFEGSTRLFLSVLGYLLGLTLIEVILAYFQVPLNIMLTILMGLSLIKAALIIAYFMHLRFERLSLVLTLVPVLVVCICLLFVFFPDSFRSLNLRMYR
jgi:cytochrome c oxidase subunit IV